MTFHLTISTIILQMEASTATKYLKMFIAAGVKYFGNEFFRSPKEEDGKIFLRQTAFFKLVRMLGSIDSLKWV